MKFAKYRKLNENSITQRQSELKQIYKNDEIRISFILLAVVSVWSPWIIVYSFVFGTKRNGKKTATKTLTKNREREKKSK